jgi:hypothetical protein
LFTEILLAACSVSTTSFRHHSLPVVLLEPSRERLESIIDVVLYAFGVRSRVVAVQILVYVHYKVVGGVIGVLDLCQSCCRTRRDKGLRTCESLTGHQDEVLLSTGATDSSHDSLDGIRPLVDVGNVLGSGQYLEFLNATHDVHVVHS